MLTYAVTRAAAMGCIPEQDAVALFAELVTRMQEASAAPSLLHEMVKAAAQLARFVPPIESTAAYVPTYTLSYIYTHIGRFSFIYTHTHRSVLAQLSYIYTYAYTLACTYTYAYTRRSVPAVNTPEWGARWGSRVLETCDKRMAPLIAARLQVLSLLALLY